MTLLLINKMGRMKRPLFFPNLAKRQQQHIVQHGHMMYHLKVHKNDNCFGSDFEFGTISLLVCKKNFLIRPLLGGTIIPLSLRLRGIEFNLV